MIIENDPSARNEPPSSSSLGNGGSTTFVNGEREHEATTTTATQSPSKVPPDSNHPARKSSSSSSSSSRTNPVDEENLTPAEIEQLREEREAAPPRNATWTLTGLMVIADTIGVGIMSLTSGYVTLGWVLGEDARSTAHTRRHRLTRVVTGVLSTLGWGFVALWMGLMMEESREVWPTTLSLADMAFHAFHGSTFAKHVIATFVYLNVFLVMGEYALVMGQAFGFVFFDLGVCSVVWVWVSIGVALPFIQLRVLSKQKWLLFMNYIFILTSILVALVGFSMGEFNVPPAPTQVVGDDIDVLSFFEAQALFAFAYGGASIYLEFMSEMRHPHRFRKSVGYCASPLTILTYLAVAIWSYALLGTSATGLLISNVAPGNLLHVSGVFLLVHMIVVFTLFSTILSRAIHRKIHPASLNAYTPQGILVYLSISIGVTVLAAIVALLIPFFTQLTSLIGSVILPFNAYVFPMMFLMMSRRRRKRKTPWWQFLLIVFISLYLVLLITLGTAGTVRSIVSSWSSNGKPFQCQTVSGG